jgi:quercetin dioxygenase-like cupin family protein
VSHLPDNVYHFQGRGQVGNTGAWIYDRVAESIQPRALAHERCRELRARILARFAARQGCAITVRAAECAWRPLAPGVTIKLLRGDAAAGNMTAFIRMEPGSSLDSHLHAQDEECLILEGEIFIGRHRLAAGDMHVAQAGTEHAPITSPRGALMLVRAELRPGL